MWLRDRIGPRNQLNGPNAIVIGVLVLVGLSGTGKGTTVDILKKKLPNTTSWSNGNVFRSLTLLAATFCTQQGIRYPNLALRRRSLRWRCV